MSEDEKTHYRKAFNSPYLSSQDIIEPTTLTIKSVRLELDKTKKTKDYFNTAYFVEPEIRQGEVLKPMILNATNSRTMKDNVRFGRDAVEGLRISQIPPTQGKKELTPQSGEAWNRAIAAYKRDGNLNAVLEHVDISEDNQALLVDACNVP